MPKSFTQKTIRVTVTLGRGLFSSGGNTKVIEGLACEATITKPGLPEKNSASVKIWGLKYEDMAQLTMLTYRPLESLHNTLSIQAGDSGATLPTAFSGEIVRAYADFNASPDVFMQFEADTGSYPQQIASPPLTVNGVATADRLFTQFAREAGYAYKNEGVTSSVQNAWFPGSPIDKMSKLARDVGCELLIDDGTVVTMPAGQARGGGAVYLSKETGLIGYPTFNETGLACRCLYNPDLQFGGLVEIKSIVPKASGTWRITKVVHSLAAYVPGGGNWETQIEAAFL